jgi:hypothetical protein
VVVGSHHLLLVHQPFMQVAVAVVPLPAVVREEAVAQVVEALVGR